MSWKQIPWSNEVAILSNDVPLAVDGSAGSAGTGGEASRDDHRHALGSLVANLDFAKHEADNLVIDQLASPPASPVQGQLYYNTADDHVYVYVVV